MRLRDGIRLVLPLVALALLPAIASAKAAREEHSLVKPFPAAQVVKHSSSDLEAYWIPLGRLSGDGQAAKVQVVEGKWTHAAYTSPAKSSVIEVGRHYDQQLRDAGFEIVYDCRDGDCGQGGRKTNGDWWDPNFQRRFLVGRLPRGTGDIWACIHVQAKGPNAPVTHEVDLVEAKPEPREMPVARDETDAGWLEGQLNQGGHVSLYGIAFDEKRLTVLPEAEPVVKAVAEVLARDPQRRLLLVVHTDDLVNWKAGVQHSRKQAASLSAALVKHFAIAPARIAAEGVGPLAPAAPAKDAPAGAGTRRVEIVTLEPQPAALRAGGNQD